jgi:hypothetical protein
MVLRVPVEEGSGSSIDVLFAAPRRLRASVVFLFRNIFFRPLDRR